MEINVVISAGLVMAIGIAGFATMWQDDGDNSASWTWLIWFGMLSFLIAWGGSNATP